MSLQHSRWYGLQVVPNHEWVAESDLAQRGYKTFVPSVCVSHRWSDRIKLLTRPMFPGYIFCQFNNANTGRIVDSGAVVRILGFGGKPQAVDEGEIENVRILANSRCNVKCWKQAVQGQRVTVLSGPLIGLEGIFARTSGKSCIIVQVTLFQRSVSVQMADSDALAVVPPGGARKRSSDGAAVHEASSNGRCA